VLFDELPEPKFKAVPPSLVARIMCVGREALAPLAAFLTDNEG